MYRPSSDAEERVFQFDEEIVKRCEAKAPVYHIGRGGAANWVDERDVEQRERLRQDSSASSESVVSDASAPSSNVRRSISSFARRFS